MFPPCPAEMLSTLCLKTGRSQSQVGSVYNRPVFFQVWSVRVASPSGGGVLMLKQDMVGCS